MASTLYQTETREIHKIRDQHPNVGQMTLAKKIFKGDFGYSISLRPMLSTYSVIRRYDATKARPQVGTLVCR